MKKNVLFRRLFSCGLSALIALSGLSVCASAAGNTDYDMVDYVFDFKYLKSGYTDDPDYTSTQKDAGLLKTIIKGIRNFEQKIDVSKFRLNEEQLTSALLAVRDIVPELFYAYTFKIGKTSDNSSFYSYVYPVYLYTNSDGSPDIARMKAELDEFYREADRYLDLVNGRLSKYKDDFSKVMFLHDEIALDCRYYYEKMDSSDMEGYNNHEMMVNKRGVCRHYSQIYVYLLAQLGIHTEMITTPDETKLNNGKYGINHRWIKVLLDGSWYNIDVTWDDVSLNQKPVNGRVEHSSFLFSDNIAPSMGYYGYKTINRADNTRYDNAPFHNYISRMCKTNADNTFVYAIKYMNKKLHLVRYDYRSGDETVLLDLTKSNAWYLDYDNIKGKPQISLEAYGDMLFYNTPYELWRYDTKTGKNIKIRKFTDSDNQYFGLRNKNGWLYYYCNDAGKPEEAYEGCISELSKLSSVMKSISFRKKNMTVLKGSVNDVLYNVTPADSADSEFKTWDFDDNAFDYSFINSGVRLTAKQKGNFDVSIETSGGLKTSCKITVAEPASKVTLNKTAINMAVGEKAVLKASVAPAGCGDIVTWTTSDKSVASVSNGAVTAKKAGKAVIRATTLSGKRVSCTVTVNNGPTGIKLNRTSAGILKGGTVRLSATVIPDTASSKRVIWSSSDKNVAVVDSSGLVRGVGKGSAVITAKTAVNGKTASCKITVGTRITGVTLSKTKLNIKKGNKFTLKAYVSPSDAYDKTVTWSSSNKAVASVDSKGTVTAVSKGTARITAKTKNGKTAVCVVNVVVPVTNVVLSKSSVSIWKGASVTLTSKVYPASANHKTLTWSSSDNSVAVVDKTGKITAKGAGKAVITAKAASGVYARCTVNVVIPSRGVNISKTSIELSEGESFTLEAALVPSNSTDSVTWSSSDTSVATVSGGVVTAVSQGTAAITVKTSRGKTAQCTVTVAKPFVPVTSVTIYPSSYNLYRNETIELKAERRPSDSTDKNIIWSSSDPETVKIKIENNRVYIIALKTGTAVIKAQSPNGVYGTCSVTVEEPLSGTFSFSTNAGQMTIKTSGGAFDIRIGDVYRSLNGGENTSFYVGDYTFNIAVYPDGSAAVTEISADGSKLIYNCRG